MPRKTFEDMLAGLKFSPETEFYTLWKMCYKPIYSEFPRQVLISLSSRLDGDKSIMGLCSEGFSLYPVEIRKTHRNLHSYNRALNIDFSRVDTKNRFDQYLLLCEYVATMLYGLCKSELISARDAELIISPTLKQIKNSLDSCGYKLILRNSVYCAVPLNGGVIEAAKVVEPSLANDIMHYGHRDMAGNVKGKRDILVHLCHYLEGVRQDVERISSSVANALFNMANQLEVRHNNIAEQSPKYKPFVAGLSQEQLEHWYDSLFKLCIAAILAVDAKPALDEYKEKQESMNKSKI